VGQLLREADKQGKPWTQLSMVDIKKLSPLFADDFLEGISVESAIAAKAVPGGTSEESVRAAIRKLEQKLNQMETKP